MDITELLQQLKETNEECEKAMSYLESFENDPLFVFYNVDEDPDFSELENWFFENNIVSKYDDIGLDAPEYLVEKDESYLSGYWFKTAEDAIAFKLRWI